MSTGSNTLPFGTRRLLRVNPEDKSIPLRDANGFCSLADFNEPGLLTSEIDPKVSATVCIYVFCVIPYDVMLYSDRLVGPDINTFMCPHHLVH